MCSTPPHKKYTVRQADGFRYGRVRETMRLPDDGLEVAEDFLLELLEALTERLTEVRVTVLPALERAEVAHDAVEAVPGDQIIGHQERELIGRQRAFLQMAHGEAARIAEGLQIEPCGHEGGMVANAGRGQRAPVGDRVERQPLEGHEGDVLGHALGEPLLGAALAAGHLDLRDVRQLVRDQAQPLPTVRPPGVVVQQQLAALADADRELAQLRRTNRRDLRILDQALLEDLPPRIDIHGEVGGHREAEVANQNGRQPAHRPLMRCEGAGVARRDERAHVELKWKNDTAAAAAGDDNQRGQQHEADQALGNPFHTFAAFSHAEASDQEENFSISSVKVTKTGECSGGGDRGAPRPCRGAPNGWGEWGASSGPPMQADELTEAAGVADGGGPAVVVEIHVYVPALGRPGADPGGILPQHPVVVGAPVATPRAVAADV